MDLRTSTAPANRIRPYRRSLYRMPLLLTSVVVAGLLLFSGGAMANSRYAAIVIDAVSGEVLHEERAGRQLYPASLTKMMTLFMTFKALEDGSLRLDQRIPITRNAAGQAPSRLGLAPGSTIRVEDAIYALVTKSANDIATAMAEAIANNEFQFAQRMTREARNLGMNSTTFQNASGLPNRRQVSTARDMALLSQALIRRFPQYYHYFSAERWRFNGRTYRNHNELMRTYEGMDGLKTGYIRAAGYNLAASAVRGRLRLIVVLFGGTTSQRRNAAVARLLDDAFASRRGRYLIAQGSAPFYPPLPPHRPLQPGSETVVAASLSGAATQQQSGTRATGASEIVSVQQTNAVRASSVPLPPALSDRLQVAGATIRTDQGSRPGLPSKVWGIQVGAFFDAATSQRAIDSAKNRVPDLLVSAPRIVMPVETSRGRMFRARIMGLDEEDALAACNRLQAAGNDCLPLSPDADF